MMVIRIEGRGLIGGRGGGWVFIAGWNKSGGGNWEVGPGSLIFLDLSCVFLECWLISSLAL